MRSLDSIGRQARFRALAVLLAPGAALPRRAGLALFRRLGDCAYAFFPRARRTIVENTRWVFPDWSDARRRRFAREVFRHLGRNGFDFLRSGRYSLADVERLVTVAGREHLDRALARGRGVVCLAAHLGCWELMPLRLRACGYPVAVVYRRLRDDWLDAFVSARRRRFDIEAHDRDGSARGMLRALRRGFLLGVLVDQRTRVDSVQVPFLGRDAWTPTGAVRLAQRASAPLVPITIAMQPDGRHRLRIGPEIPLEEPPPGATEEQIAQCLRSNVARGNLALGERILADPEQWVWFHRRWKPVAAQTARPRDTGEEPTAPAVEHELHPDGARASAGRHSPSTHASRLMAFACAGGLGLLGACQSERPASQRVSAADAPAQIVEHLVLRESRAGVPRWCLRADSALSYSGVARTELRGVQVDFFNDAGDSIQSTLSSREGEVDEKSGDLVARGSVVVNTSAGQRLETEELRWIGARGKVVSDVFVRLTKGESVITGVGIESDAELKTYVIRSAVQGTVREEDPILDDF